MIIRILILFAPDLLQIGETTISVTSVTNENSVTNLTGVTSAPDTTDTISVTTILTPFERKEYGQLTVPIATLDLARKIKTCDYPYSDLIHARLASAMSLTLQVLHASQTTLTLLASLLC